MDETIHDDPRQTKMFVRGSGHGEPKRDTRQTPNDAPPVNPPAPGPGLERGGLASALLGAAQELKAYADSGDCREQGIAVRALAQTLEHFAHSPEVVARGLRWEGGNLLRIADHARWRRLRGDA